MFRASSSRSVLHTVFFYSAHTHHEQKQRRRDTTGSFKVISSETMLSPCLDPLVVSGDKDKSNGVLKTVAGRGRRDCSGIEARNQQNAKLDRFFRPDPISPCHFSFEDVLWKPTSSRFVLKRSAPKPNPLFQIVVVLKNCDR